MKWISRRRPSPAMVIALIALFVSLSGVSYGVATGFIDSREIKNNQVRSLDIRNNEIRTRDLRNNQVRGIDIRNSSVQGRDIALNTVTGNDVNESTLRQGAERRNARTRPRSAGSADAVAGSAPRRSPIAPSARILGRVRPCGAVEQVIAFGGVNSRAPCEPGGPAGIAARPSRRRRRTSESHRLRPGDDVTADFAGEVFGSPKRPPEVGHDS